MPDREIVKEYLLEDCTAGNLAAEIEKLLDDQAYRETEVTQAFDVLKTLGADDPVSPSRKAAEVILDVAGVKV